MSSRDAEPRDVFDARIDAAARSLRRPAPAGTCDRLLAQVRAEGLEPRIDAAARALRRTAPSGLFEQIAARARPTRRLVVLRTAVALAATLVLGVLILQALRGRARALPATGLLTSRALAQAVADERVAEDAATRLKGQVAADPTVNRSDVAEPMLEEVAFLDQAIEECRAALAENERHGHLRERLRELTARRVTLLERVVAGRDDDAARGAEKDDRGRGGDGRG